MATTHDRDLPADRRVLVGALVALAGTAAVAFGRVFAGTAPAAKLVGAAILALALATLLERRNLVLSLSVSAVALVFALGVLVYPATLWGPFPTGGTFRAMGRALTTLGADASREIAPAPALPSIYSAALVAVWTASTAAHALAVRARSPVLALLPGAALLAFAGVVTEEAARPAYAAAYLAAAVGVLFGAGLQRLSLWGPVLRRPSSRGIDRPAARLARRLGFGSVVVALALPGLLPGFRDPSVIQLQGGALERVSINPFVDIRPSLVQHPATELFVVDAERPAYWRLLSLDEFDGQVWSSSDLLAEDASAIVSGGAELSTPSTSGRLLEQSFEIRGLATPWLPAAYRPVGAQFSIGGTGGAARWDPDASVLVRADGTQEGERYVVGSELLQPTPGQLNRAYRGASLGPEIVPYLELPANLNPEIEAIAREIVRGWTTEYERALAIQQHLRTFEYDVNAPAGHNQDHILFFLEGSRRGYCEQFAGTMAVLLRLLEIPARVAVGFTHGARGDDGLWHVSTTDAHAWVEAYFPKLGWIAFEPTPTRSNPVAQGYLFPLPATPGEALAEAGGEQRRNNGVSVRGRGQQQNESALPRTGRGPDAAVRPVPEPGRLPSPLLLMLAIAAAGAIVLAAARGATRRVAVARARTPADRVKVAYRVFEAAAADVGLGRWRGETLGEYGERLRREISGSRSRLERIGALVSRTAYSRRSPEREAGREALGLSRGLIRDVRRRAGLLRTIAGAFRLAPGL